jgi:hypothetical protein
VRGIVVLAGLLLGQIIAGSPEDRLYQQIRSEQGAAAKLQMLMEFENRFPQSKVLPDVYLIIIDLYRQKYDRLKIIEYGEKTLKLDQHNVTAMMALSRNYAIEGKNLDRAVTLAEQAVSAIEKMKTGPIPSQLTEAQWKDYLQNTEGAARSILEYARSVKNH